MLPLANLEPCMLEQKQHVETWIWISDYEFPVWSFSECSIKGALMEYGAFSQLLEIYCFKP